MPNTSDVLHFLMLLVDLAFTFAEICMRCALALGKREREKKKLVFWGPDQSPQPSENMENWFLGAKEYF